MQRGRVTAHGTISFRCLVSSLAFSCQLWVPPSPSLLVPSSLMVSKCLWFQPPPPGYLALPQLPQICDSPQVLLSEHYWGPAFLDGRMRNPSLLSSKAAGDHRKASGCSSRGGVNSVWEGRRDREDEPAYIKECWNFQVSAATRNVTFFTRTQLSRPRTVLGMTKVSAKMVRP